MNALDGWVLRGDGFPMLAVNPHARPLRPMIHNVACAHVFEIPWVQNNMHDDPDWVFPVSLLTLLFEAEKANTGERRYGFCEHCLIIRATSRKAPKGATHDPLVR